MITCSTEEVNFKDRLFGDNIIMTMYGVDKKIAEDIFSEAYEYALKLQKIFNFYDRDSELSKLNTKRDMKVSDDLLNVLKKAIEFSELTLGKYDVVLGKNVLERKSGNPITKLSCSYKDISLNEDERNITLNNPDVLIDLGSIAKGYIGDRLAEFLKEKGIENFLIDARGDIIASGSMQHNIGIQHPRDKSKMFSSIKLKNQAVATSGDYNQFDKSPYSSHILNQNDSISITVIAPTLEEADIYATALFVSDYKTRANMLKNNKDIKVLIIKKNLDKVNYNNFEEVKDGK